DLNEVEEKMAALFEQLAHPAAVNLSLEWPLAVDMWPERVPDLYQGQPLSLAVNFGATPPQGEVKVSGEINGRVWQKRLAMSGGADPASEVRHKGVASLWARRRISGLLDQKVAGRDADAVRTDVLAVALQHQLLSPYTSFVAVEEVVSRGPGEGLDSQPVANSRPRGQSPQAYAYPRTATTGPARAWFGGLALFLAIMLRVMRQVETDHVPAAQA
ncbi:MAG: marine proteobacterial sortase target protein, partial [Gammaproteobacteria bacterium]|nr:marine proteobacterial sortase target protein [Gammaproteobacteria bacterium]